MPKKAPEWLNADIQEFYPICQGNIRAIQRAIQEKRGVEIAYMTISDRMDQLGLERPGQHRNGRNRCPSTTGEPYDLTTWLRCYLDRWRLKTRTQQCPRCIMARCMSMTDCPKATPR